MGPTTGPRIEVSPDAAVRLALAEEWLKSFPSDAELLIISHGNEAATDLILRVIESRGAWFGAKRLNVNGLAARLAQRALAASGSAPATKLSFTAVVAHAIHSLNADHKLNYFAPVATRPGFPVAVARTLEELRMNEVTADRLAKL